MGGGGGVWRGLEGTGTPTSRVQEEGGGVEGTGTPTSRVQFVSTYH